MPAKKISDKRFRNSPSYLMMTLTMSLSMIVKKYGIAHLKFSKRTVLQRGQLTGVKRVLCTTEGLSTDTFLCKIINEVNGLKFFEQIMTATVETVSEQLDLATVMPTEKIISAMARAVTISDTDVATATVNVDKPNLMGENNHLLVDDKDDMENFWHTSMGKFRFCLTELPEQLQFVHKLFVNKLCNMKIFSIAKTR
ncbi:hypothetical protein TSAR_007982 [Trichomalopsis sarcophagae]|uniref:Uncharacterized protein n=1 Tax=Trichomalopsis sarcophagae TaxID=543379 RepID=A0A232FP04_9HYME|nr:hypothetical protein TSAR_007982 [Trichomalopsis sarcophagae]